LDNKERSDKMAVVNKLKDIRDKQNLNQEDLALGTGTARECIGRYERGERNPSLEMALRLAAYLQISVDEIFQLDEESLAAIQISYDD
jgi:putative transcriptional regulator